MKLRLTAVLFAAFLSVGAPARATNLIDDVILGSYDVPSADSNAFEQYEFSVNPFTVEADSAETNLNIIDGDLNTGVDFGTSSVVFTFQQDTTWNPFRFNGTEFAVVSGNPSPKANCRRRNACEWRTLKGTIVAAWALRNVEAHLESSASVAG